jgi:hypothetical protein
MDAKSDNLPNGCNGLGNAHGDQKTEPRYGSRLMPMVVDEMAMNEPDAVFAYVPLTGNVSDGYKAISFLDLATAVDRVAWWIHETLGPSKTFETLAYLGLSDLRYPVAMLAAIKCGYKVGPIHQFWLLLL